jgi:hypothetical protein
MKEAPECTIMKGEVVNARNNMKHGKAPGQSGFMRHGSKWLVNLCNLCNSLILERRISGDWKRSVPVPVFKGKGDSLECGSYWAIKLLEQGMKVIVQVLEKVERTDED